MPAERNRRNNFDAVRVTAALMVVVGHSWSLTGRTGSPHLAGSLLFDVAVWTFFCVSGYLVANSWMRDPSPGRFLLRRAARIFPGLIAVVAITVFVIGPIVTTLPMSEYFLSSRTWLYLTNVTLVASYQLPGVFVDASRPVVNGSLWTLGPEFCCYLVVLVFGTIATRLGRRTPIFPFILGGAGAVLAGLWLLVPQALGAWEPACQAAVFFVAGAILASLPRKALRPSIAAAVFVCWVVVGTFWPALGAPLGWLALPYAVLTFGISATPVLRRVGRFGDLSYGIYLWGFLIQQFVALAIPTAPLPVFLIVTLLLLVPIAYASWHTVESPVLSAARRRLERRSVGSDDGSRRVPHDPEVVDSRAVGSTLR